MEVVDLGRGECNDALGYAEINAAHPLVTEVDGAGSQ